MLKVFVQQDCKTCQLFKNILSKSTNLEYEIINKEIRNEIEFQKYNILSSPTSILVNKKNEEIARFYGMKKEKNIKEFIKEAYL